MKVWQGWVALVLCLQSSAIASPCEDTNQIIGNYEGVIEGGGETNSTLFYFDDNGQLAGQYVMVFANGDRETGTFANLTLAAGHILGTWTDKFGTGTLDFLFADDCNSFAGSWSVAGEEGAYGWYGSKI